MSNKPKDTKSRLHPRNKHRQRYDFRILKASSPDLKRFVSPNKYGDESIDFFNPEAVKMLNKALLKEHYQIDQWDIPEGYLCPPIPGRADYIHYTADLLGQSNNNTIPKGEKIKCLDVGVGSNCIYPIIGQREYGWSFVGSDIDPKAIAFANKIVTDNDILKGKIEIRTQDKSTSIFDSIIQKDEHFDLSICNPPFHKSAAEALAGNVRKVRNLKRTQQARKNLNFGGKSNELWCKGGEEAFVKLMIEESQIYGKQCYWFTTLISKEERLPPIYKMLQRTSASNIKTMEMGQGQKKGRMVAWTYLSKKEQAEWREKRWCLNK